MSEVRTEEETGSKLCAWVGRGLGYWPLALSFSLLAGTAAYGATGDADCATKCQTVVMALAFGLFACARFRLLEQTAEEINDRLHELGEKRPVFLLDAIGCDVPVDGRGHGDGGRDALGKPTKALECPHGHGACLAFPVGAKPCERDARAAEHSAEEQAGSRCDE